MLPAFLAAEFFALPIVSHRRRYAAAGRTDRRSLSLVQPNRALRLIFQVVREPRPQVDTHSQYPRITHLQDTLALALPRDRTMLVCHGRPTWNLSSAILSEIVQDDRSDRFWISFNDSPSFGPGKEYETA
jgi:hypothetical protein